MIGRALICCVVVVAGAVAWAAEDPVLPMVSRVARQPLVAQVRGVVDAMEVLGTPLPEAKAPPAPHANVRVPGVSKHPKKNPSRLRTKPRHSCNN